MGSHLQMQMQPICLFILILMKLCNTDSFFYLTYCFVWGLLLLLPSLGFLFLYIFGRACIGVYSCSCHMAEYLYTHMFRFCLK